MTNMVPNMKNPTRGLMRDGVTPYKFTKGFPTKDNCDLKDPREMFLWMFGALPGSNGAQLVMPIAYNMVLSEHMYECGAMLQCEKCGHAKEPIKKYLPPKANDPHWMTSPGVWTDDLDADEGKGDAADRALAGCTQIQKAELFTRLKRMHESGEF